jgi:signal peptidase II
MSRRWSLFVAVGALSLIADLATKVWARSSLTLGRPVSFIDGYWEWRLSMNPGASFNLFHGVVGARVILTVIGVIALGAIAWMVKRSRDDQKLLIWSLGLVAGGALGNLVDRVYYGVVTDFVRWHWQHKAAWPIFNIADVALVVGVGLLLIDALRGSRQVRADEGSGKP